MARFMWLTETGVPLVVQTSVPLPAALDALYGQIAVLMRPVEPRIVLDALASEIGKIASNG